MKKVLSKMNQNLAAVFNKGKERLSNEDGVTTIEWVGLAAVIVALMFAVAQAMGGNDGGIASAITSKISTMISQIGN